MGTLIGVIVAATLVWQWHHSFAMPFYDDLFDRLRFYRDKSSLDVFLGYLVSPHNEHRIMTTRLLAIADERFFSGREHTQVIVTNLLQCLSAYIAYRFVFLAELGRDLHASRRLFVFMSILLLFINANVFYTLIVPFQVAHAIMAFLVIVAATLMSRAASAEMSVAEQARLLLGLVALGIVGTFTLGNAPVVLIAAAATAVVLRANLWLIVVIGLLAVAHTVLILATTNAVVGTVFNAVAILKFALIYWGAPFLRFDAWPASYVSWPASGPLAVYAAGAMGAVVLATAVGFGLLRLFKPGFGGRLGIFGFTVLVAVVVTGIAAAHSRADFGILEAANKKYASFAALGWLGVLAVYTGIARQRWTSPSQRETPVFALLLAVLLPLSIAGYTRETRIWQKMIDRNWEASLALFLHVNDRNHLHDVYTDESEIGKYVDFIEPRGRGIFSYFPFRWGDDAKPLLAVRLPTECRGVVERLDPIPAQDLTNVFPSPGTPMSTAGWAWMAQDHAPPETVIAVDARDRIVGVARTTRSASNAEEWLGQKIDQDIGWFGFVRMSDAPPVSFIALSSDRAHFCVLGHLGDAR
ncbi:MAG: hypothetical protein QOH05_4445 [Acetobacteraceae bacterium]|nr:hypothetical protein [Acetobacteraceae bacterium]